MADFGLVNENTHLSFIIGKRKCDVEIASDTLIWKESEKTTDKTSSLNYGDIVSISQNQEKNGKSIVSLNYVDKKSVKWTVKERQFVSSSSHDCESLVTQVKDKLNNISGRPRSLLVFVNPDGGAKKGVKTYTGTVEPLFKLAGITVDVVVTKDGNHAGEVLETYDLSKVDGLVCVGGDGTFRQVLHGLITRLAREEGKDINNPETEWSTPQHPVGIIPCGTGNGVIKGLVGTLDVKTAALHILLGSCSDYHLFSVYNGGKLLSVGGLLVGYGLLAKMIEYTESHRSMGRMRYAIGMMKALFSSFEAFQTEVTYLPPADSRSDLKVEHSDDALSSPTQPASDGWVMGIKDRLVAVNMMRGVWILRRPEPCLSMQWYHEGITNMNIMKFFARIAMMKTDPVNVDHITEVPCEAYRVTGEGGCRTLNIDGDPFVLTDPVVEVRNLPKRLKVYGDQAALEALKETISKEK